MNMYKVSGIATVVVEAESPREALAKARTKNRKVLWIQADKVEGVQSVGNKLSERR